MSALSNQNNNTVKSLSMMRLDLISRLESKQILAENFISTPMASKQILIGGGTGFIGKRLTSVLQKNGYDATIVSRMPGLKRITWLDLENNGLPNKKDTVAVINLAGQNVLDPSRRWTPGFKQNVWNSRINTTSAMVRAINKEPSKDVVFVNVSGVSLYPCDNKEYDESFAGIGTDYMSRLCIEWEKAATGASCRTVRIRTGVVLGREGGMINNLYWPFFFGLGGPVGEGKQALPWIHIEDLCRLIQFAVETPSVEGVLNATAPEIVTNLKFSKELARAMRRPALVPTPECVFDLIFGKERSVLLTSGPKVVPKRTLSTGFEYKYPTIRDACREVVK